MHILLIISNMEITGIFFCLFIGLIFFTIGIAVYTSRWVEKIELGETILLTLNEKNGHPLETLYQFGKMNNMPITNACLLRSSRYTKKYDATDCIFVTVGIFSYVFFKKDHQWYTQWFAKGSL